MHIRSWLIALPLVLVSGCGALTGAALGQVLCPAGDWACRNGLFEEGLAMDTGVVTVGGERYASAMIYDCETADGRHLVVHSEPGGNAALACTMDTGASICWCIGFSH